ncbi:MAG: hypothetical protein K2J25_07695, partial [Oscillospiraceae bacterium]|nr:hypothetical protein [Oscillospiraceae bacterium]
MPKKKMLAIVTAILCCVQINLALSCIADYVQVDVIPDQTILANPEDAASVQKQVQELVEIRNILETYIKEKKLSVEPMQIATWDTLEDKPIPAEEITLIVGCETEEIADQIKNFLQEKQIDISHVVITWQMPTFEEPIVPVDDLHELKIMLSNYTLNHGLEAIVKLTETQVKIICQSQRAYDHMVALVEEEQLNQSYEMVICVLELPVIDTGVELSTDPTEESTTEPNPVLEFIPIRKIENMLGNYICKNEITAYLNITETQIEVVCESQKAYDTMLAWVQEQKFNQEQDIVICILSEPVYPDDIMPVTEFPPDFDVEKYNSIMGGLDRYIRENNISAYACGDTNLRFEQVKVVCRTEEAYQQMQAFVEQEKYNQDVDDIVVFEMRNLISSDSEEKEEVKLGDVSENGEVDVIDVIMI